jgi:hypothetical protein
MPVNVDNQQRKKENRRARLVGLGLLVLALFLIVNLMGAGRVPAASADDPVSPMCYAVSDSGGSGSSSGGSFNDVLALVDLQTGQGTFLGQASNATNIEAAEYDPVSDKIYVINGGTLGTLNPTNGEFTSIGAMGTCKADNDGNGTAERTFTINDADGLAKDYSTGNWYGAVRVENSSNEPDYLVKFPLDGSGNPTTPIEPNAFGTGISCAEIDAGSFPSNPDLIDDLGFDPVSGQLFGVANGGSTTPTRIVAINKATGVPTDLGSAKNQAGIFIPDIEGFSIDQTGQWLISTGQNGNSPTTDNAVGTINPPPSPPFTSPPYPLSSIAAVKRASLGGKGVLLNGNKAEYNANISYEDWEAISCYQVSGANARIGDYTWLDQDGDGIQDAGEPPAPGVEVTLRGSTDGTQGGTDDWIVGTVTTDANGFYSFPVPPGNYYLEFDPNRTYTLQNQGGDDTLDSDADPATGKTALTELAAGENDFSWDAGLVAATVGDFVWLDIDENGIQDPGEPGVPGIEVSIYASDAAPGDPPIATTTTDANGAYGFTVEPGDYFLVFDPAQEYTPANQGGNDALDSDAGVGTGKTANFTLNANDNDTTWDAGLVPAKLGDFVWADLNSNGQQDSGEPGVAGVLVGLFSPGVDGIVGTVDDFKIDEQYTDADGAYGFDLPPGSYYVLFNAPGGTSFTTANNGDDATDSDAVPDSENAQIGRSQKVTVAAGDENLTIDAGLTGTATIGDKVWNDTNVNGVQDGGEPGMDGVTVNLYRPGPDGQPGGGDDIFVATTTTAGGGNYSFTVAPGDYFVEFAPPPGDSFSPPGQGGDPTADSDATVSTGQTPVTTLTAGENDLTWDAGIYTPEDGTVAIGNLVWVDTDQNGQRDPGEPGIPGVPVYLYASGATPGTTLPIAQTTTSASGRYLFPDVTPGTYFVAVDSTAPALSLTPYSTVGGNHDPDNTGDHAAPNGDDGTPLGPGWFVSQDFTVGVAAQTASDEDDPINILDASSFMTIDFGFSASPTAVSLNQFSAEGAAWPVMAIAALALLAFTAVVFVAHGRSRVINA